MLNFFNHSLNFSLRTHSSLLLSIHHFLELLQFIIKSLTHPFDPHLPAVRLFFEIFLKSKQLFRQVIEAHFNFLFLKLLFSFSLFAKIHDFFLWFLNNFLNFILMYSLSFLHLTFKLFFEPSNFLILFIGLNTHIPKSFIKHQTQLTRMLPRPC